MLLLVTHGLGESAAFITGSKHCFKVTSEYLQNFQMPTSLVTGNHDLEGEEFETDEDNLAAWTEACICIL